MFSDGFRSIRFPDFPRNYWTMSLRAGERRVPIDQHRAEYSLHVQLLAAGERSDR